MPIDSGDGGLVDDVVVPDNNGGDGGLISFDSNGRRRLATPVNLCTINFNPQAEFDD